MDSWTLAQLRPIHSGHTHMYEKKRQENTEKVERWKWKGEERGGLRSRTNDWKGRWVGHQESTYIFVNPGPILLSFMLPPSPYL